MGSQKSGKLNTNIVVVRMAKDNVKNLNVGFGDQWRLVADHGCVGTLDSGQQGRKAFVEALQAIKADLEKLTNMLIFV